MVNYNIWQPEKDIYEPGLNKDDWLELLKNNNVFNRGSISVMRCFLENNEEGYATCKELSEKHGYSANHYKNISEATADRVCKATNCPRPEFDNTYSKLWPILFVGKNVPDKSTPGVFIWKLRPELKEALKEYFLQ